MNNVAHEKDVYGPAFPRMLVLKPGGIHEYHQMGHYMWTVVGDADGWHWFVENDDELLTGKEETFFRAMRTANETYIEVNHN